MSNSLQLVWIGGNLVYQEIWCRSRRIRERDSEDDQNPRPSSRQRTELALKSYRIHIESYQPILQRCETGYGRGQICSIPAESLLVYDSDTGAQSVNRNVLRIKLSDEVPGNLPPNVDAILRPPLSNRWCDWMRNSNWSCAHCEEPVASPIDSMWRLSCGHAICELCLTRNPSNCVVDGLPLERTAQRVHMLDCWPELLVKRNIVGDGFTSTGQNITHSTRRLFTAPPTAIANYMNGDVYITLQMLFNYMCVHSGFPQLTTDVARAIMFSPIIYWAVDNLRRSRGFWATHRGFIASIVHLLINRSTTAFNQPVARTNPDLQLLQPWIEQLMQQLQLQQISATVVAAAAAAAGAASGKGGGGKGKGAASGKGGGGKGKGAASGKGGGGKGKRKG